MKKRFVRSGLSFRLLENEDKEGFPLLGRSSDFLWKNRSYFDRCLSTFNEGKIKFREMFNDARKVLFNREEVSNWLYKIKEETKTETDAIYIRYDVSCFDEAKIDFERIGLLAGMHQEAERYLNIMVSTESTDKDKPHYSIIDRLEELDAKYINADDIPGYYRIQLDDKIKKHPYEVRNLKSHWEEYLSFRHDHNVLEGFGDISYLLRDYHTEFQLLLVRTKPLSKIIELLDFQLKGFKGDPIDFLNHLEFRILPYLSSFAGSDYPIYSQLIKDWLRKKRFGLNSKDEEFLYNSIIESTKTFLDDIVEIRKRNDENKYNIVIRDFLNHRFSSKNWYVKDQSLGGQTFSKSDKSRAGIAFRDLIVIDNSQRHISAIECFRLTYKPVKLNVDNIISSHVKKIFSNEPLGISPLFIIVYCETKKFSETWLSYIEFISTLEFENYKLIEVTQPTDNTIPANIKVSIATHIRELNHITVYHIFLNMHP